MNQQRRPLPPLQWIGDAYFPMGDEKSRLPKVERRMRPTCIPDRWRQPQFLQTRCSTLFLQAPRLSYKLRSSGSAMDHLLPSQARWAYGSIERCGSARSRERTRVIVHVARGVPRASEAFGSTILDVATRARKRYDDACEMCLLASEICAAGNIVSSNGAVRDLGPYVMPPSCAIYASARQVYSLAT